MPTKIVARREREQLAGARRGLGCILAIAVLAAAAGCGGTSDEQTAPDRAAACTDSTLSGPTTRLTYRSGTGLDGVVGVLCERLQGLKVSHRVRPEGSDRVVIEVPRKLAPGVTLADVQAITRSGRLSFYDWEPLVIGPDGKPDPQNATVTGGQAAGVAGTLSLYEAILRAAGRPAKVEPDNSREGSVFFAVDPKTKQVYDPEEEGAPLARSRAAALAAVDAASRRKAVVHEIKPDTVVVRAEQSPGVRGKSDRWFVLKDDVALAGSEIVNPKQIVDEGPGASGTPVVIFEFTEEGQKRWQDVTREIAERGSRSVGLLKGQTAAADNQHFAIVLDDQIVSVPFIDFRQNPDGIDGATGSLIQGGFTIKSAQQLATVLRTGALAAPLELVATTNAGSP